MQVLTPFLIAMRMSKSVSASSGLASLGIDVVGRERLISEVLPGQLWCKS